MGGPKARFCRTYYGLEVFSESMVTGVYMDGFSDLWRSLLLIALLVRQIRLVLFSFLSYFNKIR